MDYWQQAKKCGGIGNGTRKKRQVLLIFDAKVETIFAPYDWDIFEERRSCANVTDYAKNEWIFLSLTQA